MNVFGFITRGDGLDRRAPEFEVRLDAKNSLYPSDTLIISFDITDDVQIAIDRNNRLYVESIDMDGNTVKTIIAEL